MAAGNFVLWSGALWGGIVLRGKHLAYLVREWASLLRFAHLLNKIGVDFPFHEFWSF